jgi:PPM family protein phosphatase
LTVDGGSIESVIPMTDRPSEWLVNGWRVAGAVVGERNTASCQDRAAFVSIEGGLVVALADGAGGRAGGSLAADSVIEAVVAAVSAGLAEPWRADTWVELVRRADAQIAAARHGGESTAVVLALGEQIVGASVGDSAAWLVEPSGVDEVTRAQQRRPMIGSGAAPVLPIVGDVGSGTVLVASGGFAKYAPRDKVAGLAMDDDLPGAVKKLIDLVRLRSGALQDDVAIMLCRRERQG